MGLGKGLAQGVGFVAGAAVVAGVLGLPSVVDELDQWAARKVRERLNAGGDRDPACVAGVRGCTRHQNYQLRAQALDEHAAMRESDPPGVAV